MKSSRPLVIFAEKPDGAGSGMLVRTASTARSRPSPSRAPGFGHRRVQHLGDLAAFTGGEVIADEAGLTLRASSPRLGSARRVIVTADST